MSHEPPIDPELRDLYPGLSADELAIAEEAVDRYVALTARVHERLVGDPEAYRQFKTTARGSGDYAS